MFVIKGKYNIAKVFLPDDSHLDVETRNQILSFLNHPVFEGKPICIMPDCHFGKGAVIGFTFEFNNYIIPNVVGVDIGCGMLSTNLGRLDDKFIVQNFDKFIRANVPHGFGVHNRTFRQSIDLVEDRIPSLYEDIKEFNSLGDTKLLHYLNSIGTLGGGNHFIELGLDENNYAWLTVHSGSRNFGLQVCNAFQNKATASCATYFIEKNDLNFLHSESKDFYDYLRFMEVAQQYATVNRKWITEIILGFFNGLDIIDTVETIHNYVSSKDNIIRKGAVSARKGEKLIIPFNQRDGLIICSGKGNHDWNYSAPHGAGRILSRTKAKEVLDLSAVEKEMSDANIYTTSVNKDTLDESRGAYKDKDMIIDMIKDTVDILSFVKPIYNFKAGGE